MLIQAMVIGAFDDAARAGMATATLAAPMTPTDAKTPNVRFFTATPLVVCLARKWATATCHFDDNLLGESDRLHREKSTRTSESVTPVSASVGRYSTEPL